MTNVSELTDLVPEDEDSIDTVVESEDSNQYNGELK